MLKLEETLIEVESAANDALVFKAMEAGSKLITELQESNTIE